MGEKFTETDQRKQQWAGAQAKRVPQQAVGSTINWRGLWDTLGDDSITGRGPL